jgi:hypothetical protein
LGYWIIDHSEDDRDRRGGPLERRNVRSSVGENDQPQITIQLEIVPGVPGWTWNGGTAHGAHPHNLGEMVI